MNKDTFDSQTIKDFPPIQKSDDTQIRIALKSYRNSEYIDIRAFWRPGESEDYLPTKRGITIPVKESLEQLEQLQGTLEEIHNLLIEDEESKNDSSE